MVAICLALRGCVPVMDRVMTILPDIPSFTQLEPDKETFMSTQRRILSLVVIALICATACFAQELRTDYDRSTDFNQYKTYSWERVQTQDPLWVDRIKAAVNSALAAKGWTQVESDGNVSIIALEMT
jgi:hypothetical protein